MLVEVDRLRPAGAGSRRFIVESMRDRRTRRLTVGECGALTPDQARELARQTLARVARSKAQPSCGQ
jgi:hypothetical protein